MRAFLNQRDATNLSLLKEYLVGLLDIGAGAVLANVLWVNGTDGLDANDGLSPDKAKKTIAAALALATAYDVVAVMPGTYAEHLTMSTANVTLIGLGDLPKHVLLYDTTDLATAYIVITGGGCVVSNLRISNGHANNVNGITITSASNLIKGVELWREPAGTVAQDVGIALTGPAATSFDNVIRGCKFNFCTNGIIFTASTTQAINTTIEDCVFTNGVTTDIFDVTDVAVDQLRILRCSFLNDAVTKYIEVDSAACAQGVLADCVFAYATHGTKIDIDGGILPVCNRTVAGISIAAPA